MIETLTHSPAMFFVLVAGVIVLKYVARAWLGDHPRR